MDWIEQLKELLSEHQAWFWWLGALSLVSLVLAVLLLPVVVARLPADYFAPDPEEVGGHGGSWWLTHVARNGLGLVLVLAGIAMLVLPGQGVLTLMAGLVLMDLPGKRRMLGRLARGQRTRRALDWMRARRGAEPFRFGARSGGSG